MAIKVIFVNGPPRSGKDTVAGFIRQWVKGRAVNISKFTAVMDKILNPLISGMGYNYATVRENEKDKGRFGDNWDVSMRTVLITLSENFVKPCFGIGAFGMFAAIETKASLAGGDLVVFSDSGFKPELETFLKHSGIDPKTEALMIQTYREGCSFDVDSRGYVDPTDLGIPLILIENNGTLAELTEKCYTILHDFKILDTKGLTEAHTVRNSSDITVDGSCPHPYPGVRVGDNCDPYPG